jgi:Choline/Carnitine o-acyltransferase
MQVGTGRIPHKGRDRISSHPSSRHIVVLANDKAYELDVLSAGDSASGGSSSTANRTHLSQRAIAEALQSIKHAAATSAPAEAFVGYLTSADRDEWAKARGALETRLALFS